MKLATIGSMMLPLTMTPRDALHIRSYMLNILNVQRVRSQTSMATHSMRTTLCSWTVSRRKDAQTLHLRLRLHRTHFKFILILIFLMNVAMIITRRVTILCFLPSRLILSLT